MAWNGSFKPLKSYIEWGLAVSRSRLETAALPTELYPCICVKLFSLQAFCLREVSYHKRTPKVKIFWKIVVSFRQVFWTVVNCRKIKRHQEEGDYSAGSEWHFFLQKSSAYWPHFPCTETTACTRSKSWKHYKSYCFAALGLYKEL